MQSTVQHAEAPAPKKSGFWPFALGIGLLALFLAATAILRGGKAADPNPEDAAREPRAFLLLAARNQFIDHARLRDARSRALVKFNRLPERQLASRGRFGLGSGVG